MRTRTPKELFTEASERVARAVRYASKFPHLIRPEELVFQDKDWQLAQIKRFGSLDPELGRD